MISPKITGRIISQGIILFCFLFLLTSIAQATENNRTECFKQVLCYTTAEDDRSARLALQNNFPFPIRISLELTGHNTEPAAAAINLAVPALGTQALFSLKAKRGTTWRYRWTSEVHPDLPFKGHDPDLLYDLPFASQHVFPVIQPPGGRLSHFGPQKWAIDWALPEGTEILAAREGRVIALRENSDQGGPTESTKGEENFIWIAHSDGTVGNYLHLRQAGVVVSVGDEVQRGQLIGYSGNTGFSTAPHLHFHVSSARKTGPAFQSHPVHFKNP
ncbi:M23 family metallopeptidase [Kiloniella laminariae]|uniref:M23 family metallopeptidase n=1 Tax=Kiloniella laminariae TaxID=454162 RepID=UPI00035E37C1|nr:M23 family metallopeptidase [Kiloniella laminariae]